MINLKSSLENALLGKELLKINVKCVQLAVIRFSIQANDVINVLKNQNVKEVRKLLLMKDFGENTKTQP